MAESIHARSDICGVRSTAVRGPSTAFSAGDLDLLLCDFEEMVLTYGCDFVKLFEERFIDRHY